MKKSLLFLVLILSITLVSASLSISDPTLPHLTIPKSNTVVSGGNITNNYYNNTYINSTGGSQTPWTSNIDAAGYYLSGIEHLGLKTTNPSFYNDIKSSTDGSGSFGFYMGIGAFTDAYIYLHNRADGTLAQAGDVLTSLDGSNWYAAPPNSSGGSGVNGINGTSFYISINSASTCGNGGYDYLGYSNNSGTINLEWTTTICNGMNGSQGPAGPTGPTGPQGIQGDKGDAGINGTNGINGTSLFTSLNQTQFDNSTGVLNIVASWLTSFIQSIVTSYNYVTGTQVNTSIDQKITAFNSTLTPSTGMNYTNIAMLNQTNTFTVNQNITNVNITIGGILFYKTSGACDLTLNESQCVNNSGIFIIG